MVKDNAEQMLFCHQKDLARVQMGSSKMMTPLTSKYHESTTTCKRACKTAKFIHTPKKLNQKEIKVKTKCICSFSSLAWTMGPFVSNHGKAESSKQRQGLIYKFYLPKLGGKFQNFSIFSSRAPRRQKVRLQSQLGTGKITGKEMKLRL